MLQASESLERSSQIGKKTERSKFQLGARSSLRQHYFNITVGYIGRAISPYIFLSDAGDFTIARLVLGAFECPGFRVSTTRNPGHSMVHSIEV